MRRARARIAALVAFSCLVWCTPTSNLPAQSKALSTQELTSRSDVVVIGTVSGMQSEWNSEKTRITTRVTIDVREFLKGGNGEQQITVLTPGGEIGDVGEMYSGAARFRHHEEVVVFGHKKTGHDHEVVGGDQGKVPVIEDKLTREKTVHRGIRLEDFRSEVR